MNPNRGTKTNVSHNARNIIIFLALAGMVLFAWAANQGMFAAKPGTSKLNLNTDVQGVISYSDGTKRTIDLSTVTMYNPLLIVDPADANKSMTNIAFNFYVTPIFTGITSSWSISSAYYSIIGTIVAGSSIPNTSVFLYKNATTPLTLSGQSSLTSGLQFEIASFPITSTALQSLYAGWTPNTKYFWAVAFSAITMTIVFPDGTSGTQTATTGSPAWIFYYASPYSFTSLAVSYVTVPT